MEQQTVSIAKGGILGSLSARCSVIACANPSTGHYNRSRTIMENIKISNAILSRFDLVFLMLDDPDLQRDKKLSEHVMRLHSRNRKRKFEDESGLPSQSFEPDSFQNSKRFKPNDYNNDDADMYSGSKQSNRFDHNQEFVSLTSKLKSQCDNIPDREVLTPNLLKKYISYARHTVFPKLSMEACEIIKNFYISLRENAVNNANTLPITSRALDSLIRLSQARAKLELRTIVTRNDAVTVVKLI